MKSAHLDSETSANSSDSEHRFPYFLNLSGQMLQVLLMLQLQLACFCNIYNEVVVDW